VRTLSDYSVFQNELWPSLVEQLIVADTAAKRLFNVRRRNRRFDVAVRAWRVLLVIGVCLKSVLRERVA